MKSMIRLGAWLLLSLFLMPGNSSAVPVPRPKADDSNLPSLLTANPVKEDPKDDELQKLLKARYNEAVAEARALYQMYKAGRAHVGNFAGTGGRLLQAGLDLYRKPAERITLLKQYLELAREVEKVAQAGVDAGRVDVTEVHRARYLRLDAQIKLLRTIREAGGAKSK